MKRKREENVKNSVSETETEIRCAIQVLSLMAADNLKLSGATCGDRALLVTKVPIKPFISLCKLLVQVLDKIGPTMAVLRQDINQNIQRLESFYESDPLLYGNIVEILKKEVNEGKAKKGPTCCKAFVWLTRSLNFTLALMQLLGKDSERNMEQAVEESYKTTLKPWHGWISSTAYKIALKLVPDTKTFLNILKDKDDGTETLEQDMQDLVALLTPVLQQNSDILRTYDLDKLKSA